MDDVEKFQKTIGNEFKKFKLSNIKPSFKEICFPIKYTYQLPQLFVSNFINPNTEYKGLLIYHKIGAGKTCAAVQIAEQWKTKRKIFMICPASLINNFYKEISSECTGNTYVTIKERKLLESLDVISKDYADLIIKINSRIDKHYNIYSYNKFVELITMRKIKLNNALLIIDEVQNIISENGRYYQTIFDIIKKSPPDLRVVIMSATPIFDKPSELGLTLNLLKPKEYFPIGNKFNDKYIEYNIINKKPEYNIINEDDLRLKLNGLISYYRGAPDYVFPQKIQKIVKCPMSKYQYECYKIVQEREGKISKYDLLKLPNNFFIGSRIISNIAYPQKHVNELGLEALNNTAMKLDNLKKYSTKFFYLTKRILRAKGTIFIYSHFKAFGGLVPLIKILEYNGFTNFLENGLGKKRYAVWSGDETIEQKQKILNTYNLKSNFDGSLIKIILGSPSIKEGVSLLRTRSVHILEPYWNMQRIEQIIGRAVRFCSHKDVEKDERYVKIYLYLATKPKDIHNTDITIDDYIYNIAKIKKKITDQFEKIIKKSAIDYKLFQDI